MAIRGVKLMVKQPAAIELPRRVYSTGTRLHYYYIVVLNKLETFAILIQSKIFIE